MKHFDSLLSLLNRRKYTSFATNAVKKLHVVAKILRFKDRRITGGQYDSFPIRDADRAKL